VVQIDSKSLTPTHRRPAMRRIGIAAALVVLTAVTAGCGSDKREQPLESSPTTVVDGRQGAGPGGANGNGKDTGETGSVAPTTGMATADTLEQIGDQSPGGGDSNGLPKG
jgi:hypothetical protein